MTVVANGGGRNRRCLMKKERMRRTILAAMIFTAVAAIAMQAEAGIRVSASVNTPGARIHACNDPSCYHHIDLERRMPARRYDYYEYEVTRRDRKIARRLAWYTGVRKNRLLRMRRRGYHWFEIGRALRVPRPVVRAAFNQRSWNRFLHHEYRHAGRRKRCRHGDRVTYYEGREYRRRR
jgi:hypothetical protein